MLTSSRSPFVDSEINLAWPRGSARPNPPPMRTLRSKLLARALQKIFGSPEGASSALFRKTWSFLCSSRSLRALPGSILESETWWFFDLLRAYAVASAKRSDPYETLRGRTKSHPRAFCTTTPKRQKLIAKAVRSQFDVRNVLGANPGVVRAAPGDSADGP